MLLACLRPGAGDGGELGGEVLFFTCAPEGGFAGRSAVWRVARGGVCRVPHAGWCSLHGTQHEGCVRARTSAAGLATVSTAPCTHRRNKPVTTARLQFPTFTSYQFPTFMPRHQAVLPDAGSP